MFVDVDCLKEGTSRVRVYTENPASTSRESPEIQEVKGKVQKGDWYQLKTSRQCCFTWDEFEQGLTSSVSGLEPWVETEFESEQWLPVGMTLLEEGESTTYPREDSHQTVQEKMRHIVRENDLTFWEQGLEAGMFGR